MHVVFRPYRDVDLAACLALFDTNCPEYFAPEERGEYLEFLEDAPEGYQVCEVSGRVLGVFGLALDPEGETRLDWLMVDARAHGRGLGAKLMERVIHTGRAAKLESIGLATSQKVAPFYVKYGATITAVTVDGYGAGLDRVDMVLPL